MVIVGVDQTQLISSAFPLVGGGAIGFGVGYVIKKLMKLAFIGLGLVMLVLGYLEYKFFLDSIRARAREEMISQFVQVGGG